MIKWLFIFNKNLNQTKQVLLVIIIIIIIIMCEEVRTYVGRRLFSYQNNRNNYSFNLTISYFYKKSLTIHYTHLRVTVIFLAYACRNI